MTEGRQAGSGCGSGAGASRVSESVTFVPQPDGLSCTTPLAPGASHSTFVSGSTLVMRISPSSER